MNYKFNELDKLATEYALLQPQTTLELLHDIAEEILANNRLESLMQQTECNPA
jgi:hypothetical protein